MSVREVSGNGLPIEPVKGKKSQVQEKEKAESREGKDRVELSEEARAMYEATQSRRIDDIREKIRDGFYLQPDVTEKVADAILKDFRKESKE